MDTLHYPESGRSRRRYTAEFKTGIVTACLQPGASIAAIALANQINANVLRRWVRVQRLAQAASIERCGTGVDMTPPQTVMPHSPALVPVRISNPVAQPGQYDASVIVSPDTRRVARAQEGKQSPHAPPPPPEPIRLEVRRGDIQLNVAWPAMQADTCARWLRELLQ